MDPTCNFTSPTKSVAPGSPVYNLSIFTVIFVLAFMLLSCSAFLYYQQSFVFLRRRPFRYVLMTCGSVLATLCVSAVYDVVGQENYPCLLLIIVFHLSITISTIALTLKVWQYSNQTRTVRITRLLHAVAASSSNNSLPNLPMDIPALANRETFAAYMRFMKSTKTQAVSLDDKRLSLQFMKSSAFVYFWALLTFPLAILALVVRIVIDDKVLACPNRGCQLGKVEIGFQLTNTLWCMFVVFFSFPRRARKHDQLRILQEVYVIVQMLVFVIAAFIICLVDPGDLMVNGKYDWVNLVLVCDVMIVYYQTWHQIYLAKQIKRKLFTSMQDLEACFEETVADAELNKKLRMYLDSELSSEVYYFGDAVKAFKSHFHSFAGNEEEAWTKAKEISDKFIKRGAAFEVNIGSRSRDLFAAKFATNIITPSDIAIDVFDVVMEEVHANFLRDGFRRFLLKMERDNRAADEVRISPRLPLGSALTNSNNA